MDPPWKTEFDHLWSLNNVNNNLKISGFLNNNNKNNKIFSMLTLRIYSCTSLIKIEHYIITGKHCVCHSVYCLIAFSKTKKTFPYGPHVGDNGSPW